MRAGEQKWASSLEVNAMRLRNDYQKIARKLTENPQPEDLRAAQEAIRDLLQERLKLAARIAKLEYRSNRG